MTTKLANGLKGTTVSISPVPKFNELPIDIATQIIYDRVVTVCEEKRVKLSWEGNHSPLGRKEIAVYYRKKQQRILFNVEMVQIAFEVLDDLIIRSRNYNKTKNSTDISQDVTQYCKEFISNGDLIVAMLLKGYWARFGKKRMLQNAHFNVSLMRKAYPAEED